MAFVVSIFFAGALTAKIFMLLNFHPRLLQ